ncbi:hypothetical protein E4T66_18480 [Sinimarinibacterium sp. CAU 1509]|uniref:hypothetical protein n=1 Tax=Sinimarinibacterium sp. CAU 1509 TaxID=2562283 RepID=UPI0010AC72C6|nr:hypothetical protein [Sinimarinibacterium sp. CAU 1509]TJY57394.1 hypothetical protein E4T66_18480 [Sinimarinibacterium sp. CAU 1509]
MKFLLSFAPAESQSVSRLDFQPGRAVVDVTWRLTGQVARYQCPYEALVGLVGTDNIATALKSMRLTRDPAFVPAGETLQAQGLQTAWVTAETLPATEALARTQFGREIFLANNDVAAWDSRALFG